MHQKYEHEIDELNEKCEQWEAKEKHFKIVKDDLQERRDHFYDKAHEWLHNYND